MGFVFKEHGQYDVHDFWSALTDYPDFYQDEFNSVPYRIFQLWIANEIKDSIAVYDGLSNFVGVVWTDWLHPDHWASLHCVKNKYIFLNKTELILIVGKILHYFFTKHNLNIIRAFVLDKYKPMVKYLKKLGFYESGTFPYYWKSNTKKWHDAIIMNYSRDQL